MSMEKLFEYLAWKMPRRLVYWCAIRLMSSATCGKYSDTHPDEISVIEALDAWEGKS